MKGAMNEAMAKGGRGTSWRRSAIPCLPFPFLLTRPIELNVFGFIYFPGLLLAIAGFGGLILVLNLRTLLRARRRPAGRVGRELATGYQLTRRVCHIDRGQKSSVKFDTTWID